MAGLLATGHIFLHCLDSKLDDELATKVFDPVKVEVKTEQEDYYSSSATSDAMLSAQVSSLSLSFGFTPI